MPAAESAFLGGRAWNQKLPTTGEAAAMQGHALYMASMPRLSSRSIDADRLRRTVKCGAQIQRERLRALPTSTRYVKCA